MNYSQYCRIESAAGGVACSDRAFIRAALRLISEKHRRARSKRAARHEWLRAGLAHKSEARRTNAYLGL